MIIDTARNRTAYLNVVELVRSRRALAFVGAGVTCPLGYPDWPHLIDRFASEIRAAGGEEIQSNGHRITVGQVLREFKQEPLVQAQILKENLGERYFQVMSELFGPKQKRIAPIADLVSLPFKHLLTSNYDSGLEQHHKPADQPVSICLHHDAAPRFITEFADEHYTRRVVHVHGRHDEPRQIILTEQDYGTYVRSAVLDQFWRVVPVAGRLVFFGFSFSDIDLLYSFRRVRMALQGNNQGNPRHFAIMPLDVLARENTVTVVLKMKYGIEPVFFLHAGTSFAEYDDLLSRLKMDVTGGAPDQLAEEAAVIPPGVVVEAEAAEAPAQRGALPPELVQEGVESLKRMTLENIKRRQTGDLE